MEKLYALNIKEIYLAVKAEGWPFIFICGYLFFEYVRPQSIYTWIDVVPWPSVFIMLSVLGVLTEKKKLVTSNILNKLMIVYGLVVLLSSALSQYKSVSFAYYWVFFNWLLIYFLIVTLVNNEKRFFIFFLSFLLYSFKMSQHAFISWASRGFAFTGWGVTGAPGWFHNSGEVGIQMCIFVPLSLAFILGVKKYVNKKWLWFLYTLPFTGVATIIASSSRGALVGVIACALVALTKTKYFFKTVFGVVIIGTLLFNVVPDESKKRFESSGDDKTSLHRLERWEDGVETAFKYPVLGVGFSAWETYYNQYYEPEIHGSALVHNVFVQCVTELGFLGLFAFLFLILFCFITDYRVRKLCSSREDKYLACLSYGFDLALVGYLVSGSFVTVLYYPFFWIHCTLVSVMYNVARSKHKSNLLILND